MKASFANLWRVQLGALKVEIEFVPSRLAACKLMGDASRRQRRFLMFQAIVDSKRIPNPVAVVRQRDG